MRKLKQKEVTLQAAILPLVMASNASVITKGFHIFIMLFFGLTAISQPGKKQDYSYTYYYGNEIFASSMTHTPVSLGVDVKVRQSDIIEASKSAYHISQVAEDLKIESGMILFWGIQSPLNSDWLYLERDLYSNRFNVSFLSYKTGEKWVIFNERNSPIIGRVMKPISWSVYEDLVYMESIVFDAAEEHEGIYSYNISSGDLKKLDINPNYMSTPQMSPDKRFLFYSVTTDKIRNTVEGSSHELYVFDIAKGKEKKVYTAKSGNVIPIGWVSSDLLNIPTLPSHERDMSVNSPTNLQQLTFKLPWSSGTPYCISRTGKPAPSGTTGSSYYCGSPWSTYSAHGYIATDFDSPNNTIDQVRAIAAGFVTTARSSCTGGGYGKYVIITHSDGSQSLYAHLNALYVSLNQQVEAGCPIGDGGNTEVPNYNETCTTPTTGGDHIHFEYRVGGSKQYATFSECGCIPKQAYRYTSGNTLGSCTACLAPIKLAYSSLTTNSVIINWTSPATSFQIRLKRSSSTTWTTWNFTGTSVKFTGLASGTCYQFQVRAICNGVYSTWSSTLSFCTSSSLKVSRSTNSNSKRLEASKFISTIDLNSFLVYPNPIKRGEALNIVGIQKISLVELHSPDGRIIFSTKIFSDKVTIPITTPASIYFLKIVDENNQASFHKIIVQ